VAFTDRLIAGLADRYSIERELGQGGMAYVYLGQDLKHRRPVAIKVLRPDLAAALGAERFLREIEVTARLTHPRIVPIFDSGRVGDLLYYVMPFVAGESLRARMQREGQMPVADAVALTVAVAAALDYAHRQGIVHRDIKPENILLPEGEALVADFGIARTLAAALEPADGGRLTETGFAIGTPIYMSPEQAASELGVDGRSDQFALACVLFEMLVGEPPFRGPNSQAIAARRAVEPMPSIRTVRPGVPAAVEHVIRQALEKAPADRFPTAQAFADALVKAAAEPVTAPTAAATPGLHPRRQRRSLLAVTAVLAAGLLVAAGVASRLLSRRSVGAVPPAGVAGGLAVLAFDNLTAVAADSTLATGLAAELAGELRQVRGLRVAAPASAFSYRGSAASLDSVARALGVRRLVTGALRRSSDSLRIDVQLFDAAGGKRERIGRYEARGMVSFAQQDSIVLAIVTALQGQVAEGTRRRVIHHGTTDLAAQSAYFRARAILATRINLGDALAAFDEAIARDSLYAKAWAGRADAYAFMGIMCCSLEPADALPLARAAVLRALELDPTSAEAHTSLAIILQQGDKNIRAAQAQLDTALALDSTYAEAHLFAAWTHIARHKPAARSPKRRRRSGCHPGHPSSACDWARCTTWRAAMTRQWRSSAAR
jgi:serine/threonine-protein kinase